jgi:uncharacterized phage-associated protein
MAYYSVTVRAIGGREHAMKTTTTAMDVTAYLLWLSANADPDDPIFLTNLHIQKLLFYAQGWALAEWHSPLFEEQVEAWVHGPAVYRVWKRFEDHGKTPIDPKEVPTFVLSDTEKELIRSVWEAYKGYSAPALRDLSHVEDPWRKARQGLSKLDPSRNPIPPEELEQHFKEKLLASQRRLQLRRAELNKRSAANMRRRAV